MALVQVKLIVQPIHIIYVPSAVLVYCYSLSGISINPSFIESTIDRVRGKIRKTVSAKMFQCFAIRSSKFLSIENLLFDRNARSCIDRSLSIAGRQLPYPRRVSYRPVGRFSTNKNWVCTIVPSPALLICR